MRPSISMQHYILVQIICHTEAEVDAV